MARAFCIVYDAGGQKGLKKHTDGRKEGATLLLLLSTPGVDFEGGGTRFFPSVLEPSFDAKPAKEARRSSSPPIPYSAGRRGNLPVRPIAWTFVNLHAIEPTRSRGQTSRRWRGIATPSPQTTPRRVESPRHRAEAAEL